MSAVDDFDEALNDLLRRQSLTERAEQAVLDFEESERQRKAQQRLDLEAELRTFMRNELGMAEHEMADLEFTFASYDTTSESCSVKVDSFTLRNRYMYERVATLKSSQFAEEMVYDLVSCIEVRVSQSYSRIESLLDLGKALRV
jgi:hypothetical protein